MSSIYRHNRKETSEILSYLMLTFDLWPPSKVRDTNELLWRAEGLVWCYFNGTHTNCFPSHWHRASEAFWLGALDEELSRVQMLHRRETGRDIFQTLADSKRREGRELLGRLCSLHNKKMGPGPLNILPHTSSSLSEDISSYRTHFPRFSFFCCCCCCDNERNLVHDGKRGQE